MNKQEYRLLRYLRGNGPATYEELQKVLGTDVRDVLAVLMAPDRGLVRRNMTDSARFELTPRGLSALGSGRDAKRQRWLDRIVGFASGVAATVLAQVIVKWLGV